MEQRLLLILILVCFACGCSDKPKSPVALRVRTDTAEGQFKWIVQKLEHAVLDFSSTRRSGLTIYKRKVDSELIPPADGVDHYRGRITISYEAKYIPEETPALFDKEKQSEKRREEMKKMEQYAGLDDEDKPYDPLAQRFQSEMEDLAAKGGKPLGQPNTVETPKLKNAKVYELAHLDGRWKLMTDLDSNSEKNWFAYALGEEIGK